MSKICVALRSFHYVKGISYLCNVLNLQYLEFLRCKDFTSVGAYLALLNSKTFSHYVDSSIYFSSQLLWKMNVFLFHNSIQLWSLKLALRLRPT